MNQNRRADMSNEGASDARRHVTDLVALINDQLEALADDRTDASVGTTVELANVIVGELTQLRQLLKDQFEAEERAGYWADVLANTPELAEETNDVHREHAKVRETLEGILELVTPVASHSFREWQEIDKKFLQFAWMLASHESHKNRLIQRAFCDDVGTID
ncbi:MAG: hypothetical protein DWQ31_03485 [Planctomycetota bacterium]|nr:MAG: hypothetical protein DWQ31_03485 [Planctomycetota bacterium]REJ90900.1 MAG: hypothetical protein DWQ35_15560 [Planctomycetota bacterium]